MYINPDECVDCGACKLACEAGAIYYEIDLPEAEHRHLADNAEFFADVLPGRDAPLGSPDGAGALGPVGVDTPLVTTMATRNNDWPSELRTFAPAAAFVDGGM
jgi:ferredoxin